MCAVICSYISVLALGGKKLWVPTYSNGIIWKGKNFYVDKRPFVWLARTRQRRVLFNKNTGIKTSHISQVLSSSTHSHRSFFYVQFASSSDVLICSIQTWNVRTTYICIIAKSSFTNAVFALCLPITPYFHYSKNDGKIKPLVLCDVARIWIFVKEPSV